MSRQTKTKTQIVTDHDSHWPHRPKKPTPVLAAAKLRCNAFHHRILKRLRNLEHRSLLKENQGKAKIGGCDEHIWKKQLTITRKITDGGKDVQKSEASYTMVTMWNGAVTLEHGLTVLQKVKQRDTVWCSHSALGIHPRDTTTQETRQCLHKTLHTNVRSGY